MRAQITLEALVLVAIGISLLLIASVAIQKLGSAQQDAHSFSLLKSQVYSIANSADEICVLGEGNSRVVPLSQYAFEIESGADGKGIILRRGNFKTVAQTLCRVDIRNGSKFDASAFLWYENSQVVISSSPHR